MLVRYKTIPSLFHEIDQLFTTGNPVYKSLQFSNPTNGIDMKDSGDAITIIAELPGISKDMVSVTLHDNVLSIVAERKKPGLTEKEQWIRNEIAYGKFERTIDLPYPVISEKIIATHENGLLRIVLPKAEEAKPKQISIR